ncbi:protein D2-like [Lucilia sericata]|uniref:protein D2-like n=1 Tax=Lucilia sericata TaxID=13632 RepID=UPI0018A82819|nr:protein D2-like [Lucilia sericata]
MDTSGIIPDIIDSKPATIARVTYGDSSVTLGNELQPRQVKDQPEVTWKAEEGSLYTLLMVDPDAPSRETPTYREILHWLVINIPGCKLSEGQVVAEYIGSGPPEGSGLHRYVFLVFKQTQKISTDTFISNKSREGRLSVKTRDYIANYKLGDPVAGNYYQAQYDDYVPILKAQLN